MTSAVTRRRVLQLGAQGAALWLAGCHDEPQNPASLWLGFAVREVDLTLLEREPPPF